MSEIPGGHGFDKEAEDTGDDYLLQSTIHKLKQDNFQGDIEAEAHALSSPLSEKRHALNKIFWESEMQRELETMTSYEIRYNEERGQNEMYHPEFETFLQDMLLRTKRYAEEKNKPNVFNQEESDSIVQAERALVSGTAQTVLYPVWHESGNVRYVVEMTIDGSTVQNKYVDVGKIAGKDLSQKEALLLFQSISMNRQEAGAEQHASDQSYPMLFLKNGEVGFGEIAATTSEKFQKEKIELFLSPDGNQRDKQENYLYAGKQYLQDGSDRRQGLMGTLQMAERLYKEKFIPFIQHKKADIEDHIGHTKEKPEKNITRQVSAVVNRIEREKEKKSEKKKGIVLAEKTGIGIGGALFLLKELAEPVVPISRKEKRLVRKEYRKMKRVEKERIKIHGKNKQRHTRLDPVSLRFRLPSGILGTGSGRNDSFNRSVHMLNKDITKQRDKEKRKTSAKEKKTRKKIEKKKHVIFSLKEHVVSKRVKEKGRKETLVFRKNELTLLSVLRKITGRIENQQKQGKRKIEGKRGLHKQEKQMRLEKKTHIRRTVLEFIQAYIFFLLLTPAMSNKPSSETQGNVVFLNKMKKEEQGVYESSPWVLLAIIWRMTAIREQGIAVPPPKKKKKKKGKTSRLRSKIPKFGIIYAQDVLNDRHLEAILIAERSQWDFSLRSK